MKRIFFLAAAALSVLAVSAQKDVVKEAERAMKAGNDASKVVEIITPAFSDPTTSGWVETYYVPGMASFKQYDSMTGLKQLGRLPEGGDVTMGGLLVDGYNYFTKALPLDSVPDEKGKVKPKRSKEMINIIAGHYPDFVNCGVEVYNAHDYQKAYDLWNIFTSAPDVPAIRAKINPQFLNDTTISEVAYNQGLAAWQLNNYQNALDAFTKARKLGYTKKAVFDNSIAVASELKRDDLVLAIAEDAIPLYGKEDPMYISQVANYYLTNKQLDKAFDVINKAIEMDPTNAQYYVVRGVLYENTQSDDPAAKADAKAKAKADYEKALSIDAKNPQAKYNFGRLVTEEAFTLNDAAPTRQDEFIEYFNSTVRPKYLEAAEILEAAYDLDDNNKDALRYLEQIYYQLNDETKLNDVKNRLKY